MFNDKKKMNILFQFLKILNTRRWSWNVVNLSATQNTWCFVQVEWCNFKKKDVSLIKAVKLLLVFVV